MLRQVIFIFDATLYKTSYFFCINYLMLLTKNNNELFFLLHAVSRMCRVDKWWRAKTLRCLFSAEFWFIACWFAELNAAIKCQTILLLIAITKPIKISFFYIYWCKLFLIPVPIIDSVPWWRATWNSRDFVQNHASPMQWTTEDRDCTRWYILPGWRVSNFFYIS